MLNIVRLFWVFSGAEDNVDTGDVQSETIHPGQNICLADAVS